jgi:hypothetical protein
MDSIRKLYAMAVVGGLVLGLLLKVLVDRLPGGDWLFFAGAAAVFLGILATYYWIETRDLPEPVRLW